MDQGLQDKMWYPVESSHRKGISEHDANGAGIKTNRQHGTT